jgi:hypothetical protein
MIVPLPFVSVPLHQGIQWTPTVSDVKIVVSQQLVTEDFLAVTFHFKRFRSTLGTKGYALCHMWVKEFHKRLAG